MNISVLLKWLVLFYLVQCVVRDDKWIDIDGFELNKKWMDHYWIIYLFMTQYKILNGLLTTH